MFGETASGQALLQDICYAFFPNNSNLFKIYQMFMVFHPTNNSRCDLSTSYIIASIDMIREIMKRWWKQLQMMSKKEEEELNCDLQCSR